MFVPELIGAIVALLQVEQGIEQYKKYKAMIEECVEASMAKAEQLAGIAKEQAGYQQRVFDHACNIKRCVICNTKRFYARLSALRRSDAVRQQAARTLDRGQMGLRSRINRESTLAALVVGTHSQLDADRAERLRCDARTQFYLNTLSGATSIGQYPNGIGSAYRAAGEGFVNLQNLGASRAAGGLTAFGAATNSVFKRIESNRDDVAERNANAEYGRSYEITDYDRHPPLIQPTNQAYDPSVSLEGVR